MGLLAIATRGGSSRDQWVESSPIVEVVVNYLSHALRSHASLPSTGRQSSSPPQISLDSQLDAGLSAVYLVILASKTGSLVVH